MTRALSRRKLAEISDWYDSGGGASSANHTKTANNNLVLIRNDSGADVGPMEPLRVTGRLHPTSDAEEAANQYYNRGVEVVGTTPANEDNEDNIDAQTQMIAVTAESISSGGLGRAYLCGAIGAPVYCNDPEDLYANGINGQLESGMSGQFRIVCSTDNASEGATVFAYLIPSGGDSTVFAVTCYPKYAIDNVSSLSYTTYFLYV